VSELPSTWITAPLKECANINMGQSPEGKYVIENKHGLPFYQGKAEFGKTYPTPRKYCIQPTKIAQQNDILLSIRAPVGPTNLCPEESCIGRGLAGIRADEGLHQQYLLRYFKHIEPWLSQQGTGSTFKAISGGFLSDVEVVIAPLNEQIRIADKLDSVLAKVDAAQAQLEKIPTLLKRFRQSVLAAAISGELTKEWRAQYDIALEDWTQTVFSELSREITVGFVGKMSDKYQESGVKFLRSQNVRAFRFNPDNLLYISKDFHREIYKSRLEEGDLAIVRSGAPGTTCVIPKDLGDANCSDLVIVRPNDQLLPEYGCIYMNSSVAQQNVIANQVGVAQQHFNVGSMKSMPISLPTIQEQKEIVRRVESLFTLADTVEKQYLAAKQRLDHLSQSLLAKAFRGELVPQDPNDEPAAELLKRIQAERNAQPPVKNKRAKSA